MRVRAIADTLTPEQRDRIGGEVARIHGSRDHVSGVEKGKEHVVLHLVAFFNSKEFGSTVWVGHAWGERTTYLVVDPIELFDVVDPRPSRYWEFTYSEGEARLAPKIIRDNPYLNEDVADGAPEAVERWRELQQLLEIEDAEGRA